MGVMGCLFWNSRILDFRNSRFLGILEFLAFLGLWDIFCLGNSRIFGLGILEFLNSLLCNPPALRGISIWNFRIFVIASEAKQSLEILNSSLRNFRRNFRILCDEILGSSPRMTQGLGILEFLEFCYNYKQIYKPRLKNAYKSCSS